MGANYRLQHLAVLILNLSLSPVTLGHPHPNPEPQPQTPGGIARPGTGPGGNNPPAPVLPWVTVDPLGLARTITPSVITDSAGARTTTNAPPSSLTATATYTLSPTGSASLFTGRPPVAQATGTGTASEAGAFLVCNRGQGIDEPFCSPKRGSVLYPGNTYYITWDTDWFQPSNISLTFQALHSSPGGGSQGVTTHFTFPASQGYYAWNIPSDFLTPTTTSSGATTSPLTFFNVTLSLVFADTETVNDPDDMRAVVGPSVIVAGDGYEGDDEETHGGGGGGGGGGGSWRTTTAVAVPIVVVAVLVSLVGGWCFWSWRRTGVVPVLGKRRRGTMEGRARGVVEGGGFGGSDPKDKAAGVNVGIQLTDRDSWSPTAGKNVFREELRRQDAERERR